MSKKKNSQWLGYSVPFIAGFALAGVFFLIINPFSKTRLKPPLSVILSPHFDDAVLSLGGFMAETETPVVVATFFADKPEQVLEASWDALSDFKNSSEAIKNRAEENARALKRTGAQAVNLHYLDLQYRYERDNATEEKNRVFLEKDIEAVITTFSDTYNVALYGPAEFGDLITHPDHKLLHDAFSNVAQKNTSKSVEFFYYEDFPYVRTYSASTNTSLKQFLTDKHPALHLEEKNLMLKDTSLNVKIDSIKDYVSQLRAFEKLGNNIPEDSLVFTSTRCSKTEPTLGACEVVYKLKR